MAHEPAPRFYRAFRVPVAAVCAVFAAFAIWTGLAAVPEARAVSENFCSNSLLQRYGQPGDRCTAPQGGYIYGVNLVTHERAGCASIQNNGVVLDSWKCTSKNNVLGIHYVPANRWAHGIIRNNNTQYAGYFDGAQFY